MPSITDQAWWVDVAVILLPILVGLTAYYIIYRRACSLCGHDATKWQRRWYCDRCFRGAFGTPTVTETTTAAPAPPVSAPTPAPATNGPKHRRKAKPRRRGAHSENP